MRSAFIRLLSSALAAVAVLVGPSLTANALPSDTKWAIVLCKFADLPNDPVAANGLTTNGVTTKGAVIDRSWISTFFTEAGKGKGGIFDYFAQVSNGLVSLSGTTVFPTTSITGDDWYQLPLMPSSPPGEGNLSWYTSNFVQARYPVFADRVNTAVSKGANFTSYYGVLVVTNGAHDDSFLGFGPTCATTTPQPALSATTACVVLNFHNLYVRYGTRDGPRLWVAAQPRHVGLQSTQPPVWYERYGKRVERYNLPKSDSGRREHAALIGADGKTAARGNRPSHRQTVAATRASSGAAASGLGRAIRCRSRVLRWREVKEIPTPAETISSPYDPEARYSSKRSVDWVGYKIHLTETCDPDMPHLIVHVATTPAAVSDEVMVPVVHAALAKAGRLPSEHLVDAGYADTPVLLESQRTYGVKLGRAGRR